MAQALSRPIRWRAAGLVFACLGIGLIPIRYLAAPQWEVWVRNAKGDPMPGMYVRLTYENYSAESESHELTLRTDTNGYVAFSSQYRSASFFQRAFYIAHSALAGAHASFGKDAFVFAFGGNFEGEAPIGSYVTNWAGAPSKVTSTIIVKPVQNLH